MNLSHTSEESDGGISNHPAEKLTAWLSVAEVTGKHFLCLLLLFLRSRRKENLNLFLA